MYRSWIPPFLRPDFTWPRPMHSTICEATPELPHIPSKVTRRACGIFHKLLYRFSNWYCLWFKIPFDANIIQLPFGLILKWTDRTSVEEAVAMQMARAAGIPVPKVLSCGEHLDEDFNRMFSILMTRLPGTALENSSDPLHIEVEEPWLFELKECIISMRKWSSPYARSVCSALGTSLRSSRVPNHIMGPFTNQDQLHDYLLSPVSEHGFNSTEDYNQALAQATEIREYFYKITFTHGDFKAHNILVGDDAHLSAFLDWESAGWYPEYWELVTASRFGKDSWWAQVASWIEDGKYERELACDIALNSLTVDSYIAF
ncbi:unnamed protein product [Penicillium olsonii]|nr:unnamed protein product [Penicillium olsonii]